MSKRSKYYFVFYGNTKREGNVNVLILFCRNSRCPQFQNNKRILYNRIFIF